MGFSKWQAFTLITLPQTAKIAKGTYQSTIVTLVQWTSVVGYVTITDLTRTINNIGSRTMEPLFMILVGLLLYLGMAYICYGVFALADKLSALSSGKIDVIFWYGNVQGYESERDDLLITDDYYTDSVYYVTKDFDMEKILDAMEKKQAE